jgi:hypothetical protein
MVVGRPYDDYGNNPGPDGDVAFARTFADWFRPPFPAGVALTYPNTTVVNPEFSNVTSLFQNYLVRVGPLVLIALDWNTRQAPRRPGYEERGVGPTAQLHNFAGGTLQWLNSTLAALAKDPAGNITEIVFLQHHPYRLQVYAPDAIYGFSREKKQQVSAARSSRPLAPLLAPKVLHTLMPGVLDPSGAGGPLSAEHVSRVRRMGARTPGVFLCPTD